jgi:hypothetical protein
VIRRTLVYGALTAVLSLVYAGSVVVFQTVFTALTQAARSELATVLSTLAIAALFAPLRERLQAGIDRRFYQRKYDAARTLEQFGAAMRNNAAADLEQVTHHLESVVHDTMQPESAGLWFRR